MSDKWIPGTPVKSGQPMPSGFCMTYRHETCPHIFTGLGGAWETIVCPCACHPDTDVKSTKRKG